MVGIKNMLYKGRVQKCKYEGISGNQNQWWSGNPMAFQDFHLGSATLEEQEASCPIIP